MLALALLLAANAPSNCEAIRMMSTPQTIVMSAESVPAGLFTTPVAQPAPPPGRGTAPASAPAPRPEPIPPQYAKYTGTGDLKDAATWSCVAP